MHTALPRLTHRPCACLCNSSAPRVSLTHHARHQSITCTSASASGRRTETDKDTKAPVRESDHSQSDASASDTQKDAPDGRPPGRRPLILRVALAILLPVWQSLRRVFAALPGSSNAIRLGILAMGFGILSVRITSAYAAVISELDGALRCFVFRCVAAQYTCTSAHAPLANGSASLTLYARPYVTWGFK
jgi:hypothetical protein